jgi:HAD superfamily hydrolase (TIGR01484 family)
MQALSKFPIHHLQAIEYVLCDIDDTISTDGCLTPAAYSALWRLQNAGFKIIPVTGRPAGWCDHFARMWPINAIVGENGAFYFRYDPENKIFHKRFYADLKTRKSNRRQIDKIAEIILRDVPGCALTSDQPYREADIAIDFREDVSVLSQCDILRIVSIMEQNGMTAKVSSIHVNGWIGDYDKLSMTGYLFQEVFGCDINLEKNKIVFIGDSPNDQPMFNFFPNSVGVANVKNFTSQLIYEPTYITELEAGSGFVELTDLLIANHLNVTV